MIVVGLDVHKHSLSAVAVDELGRERGAWSGPIGTSCLVWARSLAGERLGAVEDCRHVTRAVEQTLVAAGERLVRVPPRLTAPSVGADARAASQTRSMRSRSHAPHCRNRSWTVRAPAKRRCAS